jgi:hypothetical protein
VRNAIARQQIVPTVLVALTFVAAARATPPPTASAAPTQALIVGTWVHVKGPTDYDSIAFALDGNEPVFRSWLHDRRASFGRWTLQGDKLTAQIDDQDSITWSVVSVSRTKLVLHQDGEGAATTYKRAKGH